MASQPPLGQGTVLELHVVDSNFSSQKFAPSGRADASTAQGSPIHQCHDAAFVETEFLDRLSTILKPSDLDLACLLLEQYDTDSSASGTVMELDVEHQARGIANMRISSPPLTANTRGTNLSVAARLSNVLSTLITMVPSSVVSELERLKAAISEHERDPGIPKEISHDTTSAQTSASNEKPAATIKVRVENVFEPFTMSAVMKVIIEGHSEPAVLKLFDRRYSSKLRTSSSILPWSEERESEYHDFIRSGEAENLTNRLKNSKNDDDDDSSTTSASNSEPVWTTSHEETFLQDECHDLCATELAAYHALIPLQGHCVPNLLATVALQPLPGASPEIQEHTLIHGLLLSHIPGFTLDALAQHVPRAHWRGVCDDAERAVNACSHLGVLLLHGEVGPRNCIVRCVAEAGAAGGAVSGAFIVGFGRARVRGEGESGEEWARMKSEVDEAGTIGAVMLRDLEREFGAGRYFQGRGVASLERHGGQVLAGSSLVRDEETGEEVDLWHEEIVPEQRGSPVYPRAFLVDPHDDRDSDEDELILEGEWTDADGGFNRAYPLSRSESLVLGVHAPENDH